MTIVEICVDDLDGALTAERGGANRVELCANLLEGGTTPSLGLVGAVLDAVDAVGVQVMIRPRGGDFVYSDAELLVMCADLQAIGRLAASARVPVGFVLGALTTAGAVDVPAIRRLLAAAGTVPVTFHRAFDATRDLVEAYEVLRELRVERILTSGGAETASAGAAMLARLVERSGAGPIILAGGSVRAHNVSRLVDVTGVTEVHLRAQVPSPRTDRGLVTDLATVADVVRAASRRGHPVGEAGVVLALDVGGTSFKGAIVADDGRPLITRDVGVGTTGAESIQRVRDLMAGLAADATDAGFAVLGAGVATSGIVESSSGVVRYASSLGWSDVPLGSVLSGDLGVPVRIGHDVRSAGLAEAMFGAAVGVDDFVFVALGTGVAASIVSSTSAVVGAGGAAGELGHIPVVPDGDVCTCGQQGCLEVYMSGAGLTRRYVALGGTDSLSSQGIVARIDADPVAAQVWRDGIDALARGLTTMTLLVDPTMFVIGGGVSRAGDTLLSPLRARLATSLTWREAPTVRRSLLGTAGGRVGAAVLAFQAAGRADVPTGWTADVVLADTPAR